MELSKKHYEILNHTEFNAAGGRYCGDSPEMQELVAAGLMRSLGKVSWCPDEYFQITKEGRAKLGEHNRAKTQAPAAVTTP